MNSRKHLLARRVFSGVKLLVGVAVAIIYYSRNQALLGVSIMLWDVVCECMLPEMTEVFRTYFAMVKCPVEEQIDNVPLTYLQYQVSLRDDARSILGACEDLDKMRRYRFGWNRNQLGAASFAYLLFLYHIQIWIHLSVAPVRQLGLPIWLGLCGLAVMLLIEHRIWRRNVYSLYINNKVLLAALNQAISTMPADKLEILYRLRADSEDIFF